MQKRAGILYLSLDTQRILLILENEKKEILGCMPSFIKTNSMGEYVFDHDWANAYHRTGNSYYPKIQVSIPYTPVTGRRFLIKDD